MAEKEGNDNDKAGTECFVVIFLMLAAGIPAATKGEGPIGTFVIVVGGLALAYYVAKALTGRD